MLGPQPAPATDRVTPVPPALLWGAVASLGLLFVRANTAVDLVRLRPRDLAYAGGPDLVAVLPFVVPALALLGWALTPRGAWPWLLLAGALAALPMTVVGLDPAAYASWLARPLELLTASAPVLTLTGLLGVACWLWQAGARASGAALVGTAWVVQLVGPVVFASGFGARHALGFGPSSVLTWVNVALTVVALTGAVGAVALRRLAPDPARPDWRVTVPGGVASASPVLVLLWQPDRTRLAEVDDYLLQLGLVFLAVGLVVAALAGRTELAVAVAAGLVLGVFGMLVAPTAEVLVEIPVVAVVGAVGAMVPGYFAARSRWRARIGAGGLGVVVLGLTVLFVLFNQENAVARFDPAARVLTPILLVVGITAAIAAVAAVGGSLAERSDLPAVLVGLSTPFALGTIALVAYATVHHPEGRAPFVGMLPAAMVGLAVVAGITAASTATFARWRRAGAEPVPADSGATAGG